MHQIMNVSDFRVFAIASIIATVIVSETIGAYLDGERGEPLGKRIKRVRLERQARRAVQYSMNLPLYKAHIVHTVNVFMLSVSMGVCAVLDFQSGLFWLLVYLAFGIALDRVFQRSSTPMHFAELAWTTRMWLRIFYAWSWPIRASVTLLALWRG